MATLGVKVETTLATDKQRYPIASLYKGIKVSGVHTEQNRTLAPLQEFEVDLTNTTVVVVLVEAFSNQSSCVDLVYTTTDTVASVTNLQDFDLSKDNIVKLTSKSSELLPPQEDIEELPSDSEITVVSCGCTVPPQYEDDESSEDTSTDIPPQQETYKELNVQVTNQQVTFRVSTLAVLESANIKSLKIRNSSPDIDAVFTLIY